MDVGYENIDTGLPEAKGRRTLDREPAAVNMKGDNMDRDRIISRLLRLLSDRRSTSADVTTVPAYNIEVLLALDHTIWER